MNRPSSTIRSDPERAFQALDLVVRRRLNGLLQGDHEGLRLGSGSDPDEVVRYRPGEDDVRRIDWNATARTQETHVWRSRSEHELDTWILLDDTASMHFGSIEIDKRELAGWAAGVVALLADGPGNRVGVARLGPDRMRWAPPLPGRVCARRTLREGRRDATDSPEPFPGGTAPPVTPPTPPTPPTLPQALSLLERRHRRPGLRVVISDFVEPDGNPQRPFDWEPALRRLGVRHDVIVVEVLDPRELELPDLGSVLLEDPETGVRQEIWTSPKLRAQYAAMAQNHRRDVAAAIQAAAAAHVQLRTDRDWVADIARFVLARRRLPRNPNRRIR